MDSIATADRNGDRQARIDARADLLTRLGYGANLILQCDPTDQKDVVAAFKERSSRDTLCFSYDVGTAENVFNNKFDSLVGTDTKPGDYWWSDYDKLFAALVIEELTVELVKSAKEKKLLGFLDRRSVDQSLKLVAAGQAGDANSWDKMVSAVQSISKVINKQDISSVKLCITGIDRVPLDEQPALFDYIHRFSVMSGVSLSFLTNNIPHTTEYSKKEGALKGIPYDRLTVRGFETQFVPAPAYVEPKKLQG